MQVYISIDKKLFIYFIILVFENLVTSNDGDYCITGDFVRYNLISTNILKSVTPIKLLTVQSFTDIRLPVSVNSTSLGDAA